jgi:hypothetical protein
MDGSSAAHLFFLEIVFIIDHLCISALEVNTASPLQDLYDGLCPAVRPSAIAFKIGQNFTVELDGYAETMVADGLVQVATDLVWTEQARAGSLYQQSTEACHGNTVIQGHLAQESFVGHKPGCLVFDGPGQ